MRKTGNRGQGTENREQRTGDREQKTGSGKREAGRVLNPSPFTLSALRHFILSSLTSRLSPLTSHLYLLFVICYLLSPIPYPLSPIPYLYASFDNFGAGARTIGIGGAYTAVGDDAFGALYNPAAISYLKRGQLAVEYGSLHLNLTDRSNLYNGYIGFAYPFIKEEIIETKVVETGELEGGTTSETTTPVEQKVTVETTIKRTLTSAVMIGYKTLSLSGTYSENFYHITYGRFINKFIALGMTVKALHDKFIIDDYLRNSPVFKYGATDSKNNVSFDLGAAINPLPNFYIGLSALNINEPDMGFLREDRVSSVYRLGAGMRKTDSRFALDLSYHSRKKYLEILGGFERYFGILGLRGGIGYGERKHSRNAQISTGVSFNISKSISLDYALNYPLTHLKNTYGSHWLSFMFQFGERPAEDMEPGSIERAYTTLWGEKLQLESRVSQLEQEKRKLEEVLIEEATARIRERIRKTKEEAITPTSVRITEKKEMFVSKAVTVTRTHIVKKGDTLQSLAEKYYKNSKLWIEIYNANKDEIGRGGALRVNQVIVIPPLARAVEPAETPKEKIEITPASPIITPTEPQIQKAEEPKIELITPVTEKTKKDESNVEAAPPPKQEKQKSAVVKRKTHIVMAGENLRIIAEKYYNNPEKWKDILDANKDKIIRGQIKPGLELVIP